MVLLKHGDREVRNRSGESPLDLLENPELRRFVAEYLVRPDPTGAEHDYAEIIDERTVPGGSRDPAEPHPTDCRVCSEPNDLVTFHPCQHKIVCEDCARRLRF